MTIVINDVKSMKVEEDSGFFIEGMLCGLEANAEALYDFFENEASLIEYSDLQNEEEINEINEAIAKIEAGLALYKNTLAGHIDWLKGSTGKIPFKTKAEQSDKFDQ